ncbi:ABC transporter C-terminal domain-containing protein [Synechocystis sp. B12]|nr:ABC transporter C-terminal domain-containing protein [Synechocystis sp. B12]
MEEEKAQLEAQLYQSSNGNFTELQNLTERLANLSESIDQKTERWLTLAERI